jgi:hypothetical protein
MSLMGTPRGNFEWVRVLDNVGLVMSLQVSKRLERLQE